MTMALVFTSKEGFTILSSDVATNPTDVSQQPIESVSKLFEMRADIFVMISAIEQAGVPALRVAFATAVTLFLLVGSFIFRKRHQLFDRDPTVENDMPVVRHNREELITLVWSGMTMVLIAIMCAVWSA
jgi:hypothetical protein